MSEANAEPVVDEPVVAADDGKEQGGFLTFFKKGGAGRNEGEDPNPRSSDDTPSDDTESAPIGLEPIQFVPSADAEKDPKVMVEEFRTLVKDDLQDGGSVLVQKEHALAMAAYYRAMDAEVAKAANGTQSAGQAGEHMAELTREELVAFWEKYAGIAFLCLAL